MIDSFQGKNRWLSNFWSAFVTLDGMEFPSVENAYQAAKTTDMDARKLFQDLFPGAAKALGKKVTIRPDWEEKKVEIMADLLYQKFSKRNPELRERLKATGSEELVEGNTWGDTFWGVCKGVGQNNLGKLLMRLRTRIQLEDV